MLQAIHLEKNTGAANGPRNKGLEVATGDYIMFLDPDDRYTPNACETLYKAIKENDADVAFGRFRRVFTQQNKTQKSYSPYNDNLDVLYKENFEISNPLNISDALWEGIFKKIVYGKRFLRDLMDAYTYCSKCTKNYSNDIQNISVNPHLLYWINTWKNSPFTKEENKLLLSKVNNLKKVHKTDLKTKLLLSSISTALETSIHTSRE